MKRFYLIPCPSKLCGTRTEHRNAAVFLVFLAVFCSANFIPALAAPGKVSEELSIAKSAENMGGKSGVWTGKKSGEKPGTMAGESSVEKSVEKKYNEVKKHLFIDDHYVQEIHGLERILHQPERKGIVLRPDRYWEQGMVFAFSAPIWVPEDGVYKWIYRSSYKDWSALAISEDGIHWEKPILNMVSFNGSKENNIFSNDRIHKVVEDPNASDPQERYKGIADRTPVVSGDLINWRDAGSDLGGGDSGSLTYDVEYGIYLAPLKIRDRSNQSFRQFDLATSRDFKTWSKPRFFFGADELDQEIAVDRIRRWLSDPGRPRPLFVEPPPGSEWTPPDDIADLPLRRRSWNAQCNNISVFPYHGQYIGLITLLYTTGAWLPDHRNNSGFFKVEIATTRDLETWNRIREPFLSPARLDHGIVDNFERMLVQTVNRPIVREDELWFYYGGIKAHGYRYTALMDGTPREDGSFSELERRDIEAGRSALYLATLRLDGFVSLRAGDHEGFVLTQPIAYDGGKLFVNLSAQQDGFARIEALDESDRVIAVSRPVTGDGVSIQVDWADDVGPCTSAGRMLRFKIHLKQADLYAFWME